MEGQKERSNKVTLSALESINLERRERERREVDKDMTKREKDERGDGRLMSKRIEHVKEILVPQQSHGFRWYCS